MLKRWTWLVLILVALLGFVGCSSDDDPVTPPTPGVTAFEAMATAGKAYLNDSADCPGVVSATTLQDNLGDYTVIDIRSESAYLNGHIPGAYLSSLATILTDVGTSIPNDKPIVVACYSGQSAGHAKIALEMIGYEDTQSLLWGMSSWNGDNSGSWDNNIGNTLTNPEVTNNNGGLVVHDFPILAGDATTIVQAQAQAVLTAGFKGIAYNDIKDNLSEYFVINYFGEADYLGTGDAGVPGHIPGSYQFTPYASLGDDQMLNNLPTDMPIVVYCWTGQHSSQVTAYLNMLGYEAYSLKNGSNNLFHSSLTAHKWSAGAVMDYDMTEGYEPNAAFRAMAEAGADYINGGQCPGVISATALNDNLENYIVIDIRSADAYNAGHIAGAYHSSLSTIVADVGTTIPADMPLVVACYSGQNAGHAKIALEMSGYTETSTLSFGMCSWNSSLSGSWDNNIGDTLTNPETSNNNIGLSLGGYHAYPTLDGETPATVVANRVAAMTAGGLKGVMYTDIQDNLDDYFIINYFGEADYLGTGTAGVPGHIPGAYQFTPAASLGLGQMLHYLPTDMPIVVYCWTSQTSSQVAAYLNMLGYDAYSLKFGSNNLFHTDLTAHKWSAAADFPLEVTPVN